MPEGGETAEGPRLRDLTGEETKADPPRTTFWSAVKSREKE